MKNKFTNWMGSLFGRKQKKATCCDCIKSLQMVVDGEATKEQEAYFLNHVDECMPCYNFYKVEKSVKEVLQNKIEKKSAPTHLVENIKSRLKSM
jgi:anti-sigma factor (TIGR02949 family)